MTVTAERGSGMDRSRIVPYGIVAVAGAALGTGGRLLLEGLYAAAGARALSDGVSVLGETTGPLCVWAIAGVIAWVPLVPLLRGASRWGVVAAALLAVAIGLVVPYASLFVIMDGSAPRSPGELIAAASYSPHFVITAIWMLGGIVALPLAMLAAFGLRWILRGWPTEAIGAPRRAGAVDRGSVITDEKRIEEVYRASTAALAAGDLSALAAHYTGDAVQLPPDAAPLVGWSAIRESLESELAGITFASRVEVRETVVDGDLACAWGHFRATVSPKAGGDPQHTSGSFVDVFRRQPDGSWRFARSAWSNHDLGVE